MRSLFLVLWALSLPVLAAAANVVGTWNGVLDGEALVLDLRADGSGTLDGDPIRYQLAGQVLLVNLQGETIAYAIRLDGDRMDVSGGDLDGSVTFVRGKGAQRGATAGAPAPGAPRGGAPEAAMAGRWCYVASFSAVSGGGSQSSRCFELDAAGRYRYESESSVSAYTPGAWGGTSGSSSDSGRWSVSGATLTATSDSGTVSRYPLEKRNHPKTGDPMLCLDGDCYVTQVQKAPW